MKSVIEKGSFVHKASYCLALMLQGWDACGIVSSVFEERPESFVSLFQCRQIQLGQLLLRHKCISNRLLLAFTEPGT